MRIALPFCLILSFLVGLSALPANADPLDDAFPAPHWKRGDSGNSLGFDCVSESCGGSAHVVLMRAPANPIMAGKIRSGALTREWAERLAETFRRQQGDQVKVLSFEIEKSQVPSWTMVYECNCEGRTNFVASRTMAGQKITVTFYSLAGNPDVAQGNMNKLVDAATGANTR
jgi:hypothetical protein